MSRYQESRRKNRPSHKSGQSGGTVSPALSTEGGTYNNIVWATLFRR